MQLITPAKSDIIDELYDFGAEWQDDYQHLLMYLGVSPTGWFLFSEADYTEEHGAGLFVASDTLDLTALHVDAEVERCATRLLGQLPKPTNTLS